MSRDGGGQYSLPAGSVFVTATVIDEAVMNALTADLEADANVDRPVTAGGTGASTAAAARANLGVKKPLSGIDTTGSANAYLFETSDTLTPSNGDTIVFVASFANTGAATLDVDSGGAKDIKKVVAGTPVALVTGDIVANALYLLTYDSSATAWIVLNPGGGTGADSIIADTGGLITATTIEGALAELAAGHQPIDATLTSLAAVAGVAGDILYASGADAWARLAKGADGEVLTLASGIPAWETSLVIKTADETVNNSTTLQDDDHLLFAMAANTSYLVDLTLLCDVASATPDLKFKWTFPTNCTIFWSSATSIAWISGGLNLSDQTDTIAASSISVTGTFGLRYKAIVRNLTNAGNLQLQWAQNTANASNSKLLKHSSMSVLSLGAT